MKAICFECGKEKSAAIKLCRHCQAMPITRREKILSVCLSSDCLRPRNLLFSQAHIFKRGLPPGFRAKVIRTAMEIVDQLPDELQVSASFELSGDFQEVLVVE